MAIPTPEVYKTYIEQAWEYPRELVDKIGDAAQMMALDPGKAVIFGLVSDAVRQECLSMEEQSILERKGNFQEVDMRRGAIAALDARTRLVSFLERDETTRAKGREVVEVVADVLASSREFPSSFPKTAPSILFQIKEWADIISQQA